MILTVAPDMTPPVWSATVPRMRPKLPWENRVEENSNTPTAAPSRLIAFPARAFLVTDFMNTLLFKSRIKKHLRLDPEKGLLNLILVRASDLTLEGPPTVDAGLALRNDKVKKTQKHL
jgi:hypothetical protein